MFSKFLNVLNEFEADKRVLLERNDALKIEKKPGWPKIQIKQSSKDVQIHLSPSIPQDKQQIIKDELFKHYYSLAFYPLDHIGERFKQYGEFDSILDDKKIYLAHQPGEILCLTLWASWNAPSQTFLSNWQQMFSKNSHWKGKVRIVAFNLNDPIQTIKNHIQNTKSFDLIHLSVTQKINDQILWDHFKNLGFSAFSLIDKFGITNCRGLVQWINVQQKINNLIQQKEDVSFNKKVVNIQQRQMDRLFIQRMEDQFMKLDLIVLEGNLNYRYENQQSSIKGNATIIIIKDDQQALETVQAFFSNYPDIKLQIDTVDYVSVPNTEGAKCWECAKPLQYPFYWLRWQEGTKFGCRECVEATTDLKGHHYKYQKNSVLLMGQWKKLAVKNLGNNIQPIHPKAIKYSQGYQCDGTNCNGSFEIGTARYICQGCRMFPPYVGGGYRDFCQDCLQKMIKNEMQLSIGLQSEYHQSNHPFLRVLYNCGGYRNF